MLDDCRGKTCFWQQVGEHVVAKVEETFREEGRTTGKCFEYQVEP